MKRITVLFIALSFVALSGFGQKIKVISGNLNTLKSQAYVNVVYNYTDELMVGKMTEDEYLEKKAREFEEKEPGKGEKFKNNWEADKEGRYHPKFEELINDVAPMKFGNHPDAEVTMTININYLDPGYNIGISKKPAYLDCEVLITDKGGAELCRVMILRAPGSNFSGADYEAGMRIQESYAIAGKRLGAMIKKACKK